MCDGSQYRKSKSLVESVIFVDVLVTLYNVQQGEFSIHFLVHSFIPDSYFISKYRKLELNYNTYTAPEVEKAQIEMVKARETSGMGLP